MNEAFLIIYHFAIKHRSTTIYASDSSLVDVLHCNSNERLLCHRFSFMQFFLHVKMETRSCRYRFNSSITLGEIVFLLDVAIHFRTRLLLLFVRLGFSQFCASLGIFYIIVLYIQSWFWRMQTVARETFYTIVGSGDKTDSRPGESDMFQHTYKHKHPNIFTNSTNIVKLYFSFSVNYFW